MVTGPNQCTSNFVFTDEKGNVYLGQAAHCASLGEASGVDGCETPSLPVGTPVKIEGASSPGVMVYNSWRTMQARHETDENTCRFNDFSLVRVHPTDVAKVNPSLPHWGGPTGVARTTNRADKVLNFGASSLLGELNELKPRQGLSRGQGAGGWNHTVYTLIPGIPGDSGSGFINGNGEAFGVLSTLMLLPEPLSNGVSDLFLMLNYANHFANLGELTLVKGTEPYNSALANADQTAQVLDAPLSVVEIVLALLGLN